MAAGRTPNRRELSLKEADNPFERDLLRPPVESITTVGATFRANDPRASHRRHDLFEDRLRHGGAPRELLELDGRLRLSDCQRQNSPGCVVSSLRNPHRAARALTSGGAEPRFKTLLFDKVYIVGQDIQDEGHMTVPMASPLSTEPEIRPTALSALALDELPTDLHFVRSHFGIPGVKPRAWILELGGAVEHARRYTLPDLKRRRTHTQSVVLECAGHRRNEFRPTTTGLQWGPGAVSEARWSGVRLAELLAEVVPSAACCEVLFEGADRGPHRSSSGHVPFARSIPLERALTGDVLLAWEMNGKPIPAKHGAPLRAVVPGSYGVASVKWLQRIELLDRPFAGPFQIEDYQLDGKPLDGLRVSSLILSPEAGAVLSAGAVELFGIAWGGRGGVTTVEVRCAPARWQQATLRRPRDSSSLTRWSVSVELGPGENVLEVRARDQAGETQPDEPTWNVLGYANNSIHRVPITTIRASNKMV
jgi:DMSO/TMAO reductase YedYZ molybdopterin-dependent catalytic subunit